MKMFFSLPKTFNDAIKPLVYLNYYAGVRWFRQENESDAVYFPLQVYAVVISLLNCTAIYFALTVIATAPRDEDISAMAQIMYRAIVYTNSCITIIAPLITWHRNRGLKDCMRRISILDETFESVLGVRNEYRKKYIHLTCQVMAALLVMVTVTIYDGIWSIDHCLSSFIQLCISSTMHHPILIMLIMDLNFRTFVGYLGKKFRDLNNALLKLATEETLRSTSNPGERLFEISQNLHSRMMLRDTMKDTKAEGLTIDKHQLLQETRKAHLELCKLTRRINAAFGIQNLISAGISFGMITGLLYTIYGALEPNDSATISVFQEIVPSAMWTAIYAFKIWMISHTCWNVSNEAQRTGEVIYELLKLKVDEELENDQIQLFSLQMLQNPVRFDACGFFNLDYTFVQGVIGSITTYLVILIQMSHLSGSNFAMLSNPLNNDTGI